MRKLSGLFIVAAVTGAIWWQSPGHTTKTLSAQTGRSGPESKASSNEQLARDLMKEARQRASKGDVVGAKRKATEASRYPVKWAKDELTPSQFLAQLDGNTSSTGRPATLNPSSVSGRPTSRRSEVVTAEAIEEPSRIERVQYETPAESATPYQRPQQQALPSYTAARSGGGIGSNSGTNAAIKERVDELMSRAQVAWLDGDIDEAIKIASLAEVLGENVNFRSGEETPAAFIAKVRTRRAPQRPVAATPQPQPQAQPQQAVRAVNAYEEFGNPELAQATEPRKLSAPPARSTQDAATQPKPQPQAQAPATRLPAPAAQAQSTARPAAQAPVVRQPITREPALSDVGFEAEEAPVRTPSRMPVAAAPVAEKPAPKPQPAKPAPMPLNFDDEVPSKPAAPRQMAQPQPSTRQATQAITKKTEPAPQWPTAKAQAAADALEAETKQATAQLTAQSAAAKKSAATLMATAKEELSKGNFDIAYEKAVLASQMDVAWGVFDERPQQLMTEIERRQRRAVEEAEQFAKLKATKAAEDMKSAAAQNTLVTSFKDEAANAKRVAKKVIEIPDSAEEAEPQPQPTRGQINDTQHARQLVAEARQQLRDGLYDDARATALKAQSLGQSFGIFDDRPETVLRDIDRVSGSVTLTKATEPQAAPKNFAKASTGPATASQTAQDELRAQAQKLLANAKQAVAAGQLDRARQLAEQAQGLNATFSIFDERPEMVLADIERLESRKQPTKQAGSSNPFAEEGGQPALTQKQSLKPDRLMPDFDESAPQKTTAAKRPAFDSEDAPRVAKTSPTGSARQAAALLAEARALLKQGRVEEAKAKAEQADQLEVTYDLFADQPQLVLAEITKLETQAAARNVARRPATRVEEPQEDLNTQSNSVAPNAFADRDAEPLSAPAADDEPSVPNAKSQREQARQLLAQARQDVEQGRLIEARRKAEYVREMELTFSPLEDRPEAVLAAIAEGVAQNQIASEPSSEPEMLPFNGKTRSLTNSGRSNETTSAVHPSGVSANDLFRQGQTALKAGDRQGAYQAFMAAHQSGQRLDAFKSQQLQDYLRELSPRKNGSKIQLTAGQADGQPEALPLEVGPFDNARPIDVAEQRDQIKFDRLRSEVLNAMLRADALKEKRPDEAIDVLDKAMAEVENAGFDNQRVAPLMGQLRKTRGSVEGLMAQKAPIIELERRNTEVKKQIEVERNNAIRVRKEFAALVDEFNRLNDAHDYAKAHIVAKQARELNPEDPVAIDMFYRSQMQFRVDSNEKLKEVKEEAFWASLNEVERALAYDRVDIDGKGFKFSDDWKDKSSKRLKNFKSDARPKSEDERKIEESLSKKISLHFDNAPLMEVVKYISTTHNINVALDRAGLEEEGVTTNTPVTIDLDNIMVKSALKLMLEPLHLGYSVEDDVLKVTSHMRQQGKMVAAAYPVADLVVSMRGVANKPTGPFSADVFNGQMSVSPMSGTRNSGQFQVGPGGSNALGMSSANGLDVDLNNQGQRQQYEFNTLVDLITSVVEPSSWQELGGQGQIRSNETTLSLVIRQTQQVHQEISDLLEQLRRLQDLQITIEVRLINVSDRFFEQIGVDFDFDFQDTVGGPLFSSGTGAGGQAGGQGGGQQAQGGGTLTPLPPFGSQTATTQQQGQAQQGQQGGQQGQQGQQAQAGGAAGNTFTYPTNRNLAERDNWGRNGTIIGLANQSGTFTPDLDLSFRQGSFDLGLPDFGNPQATAGIQVGMAILSDIETFFFIQAAQGDERANLLFAPKITMFNGDLATITDSTQRPFVASLQPTVGAFSVGFAPVISVINDGITLSVQAVASADRRFVRLAVSPNFNNLIEIQTFAFASGGAGGGQQQQGGGQQGQGGGLGGGGLGGGGLGGGGGGGGLFGVGGIGGGPAMQMANTGSGRPLGRFGRGLSGMEVAQTNPAMGFGGIGGGFGGAGQGGAGGQQGGGQQGGGQQGQQGQGGGGGATTLQQPIIETINVTTTVSVPDGGTVLLGGIKRLKEGRNMTGVPILNKIPYISRLFKNSGVGRETESLMLMVTPRIIIFEEEEELLGIELD